MSLDSPQQQAGEEELRALLAANPNDATLRKQLGDLYFRQSRLLDAEAQFTQALALAPNFDQARWMLAGTFALRGDWQRALRETETLLAVDARNPRYRDIQAYALLQLGEYERAIRAYDSLRDQYPTAENWKSYGRALKAVGRVDEAIAAYRQALALKPDYGMVWWSLAELKNTPFSEADIASMRQTLAEPSQPPQNRALLHFALGRAYEEASQDAAAFEEWRAANAAIRSDLKHDPEQRASFVRRNKQVFTPAFLRARENWGSPQSGPILIVGLPRSGSTLIEQILASHSQVEATAELQVLESVVRGLAYRAGGRRFPEVMEDLSSVQAREAGDEYLARTKVYRRRNTPFFIDKMPNNVSYLGAILTFLPNAKIIDARRHPLGTGLAIFKHFFVDAYSYAFDLGDIGSYYRDYVELVAHFDSMRPGRIHRVLYEDLVADPEAEIRKLLDYCGLPFEEQCLRFHENTRAVLTPSSEQVRRPISGEAAQLWRRYEPWLDPLKVALGSVLERYPGVPHFPAEPAATPWAFGPRLRWGSKVGR